MDPLKANMHTLIITSTVFVSSDMTVLTDAAERERQCVESILYYLHSPYLDILIVCDNSGFDYSRNPRLKEAVAASTKQVEFLCFVADKEKIIEKGKGYGEGLMMAHVFGTSRLLERSGPSVFKVTGRLIVANFDKIARRVKPGKTYFQGVSRNPFENPEKVDTRFYFIDKAVFRGWLIEAFKNVDDKRGHYLEHTYYQALKTHAVAYTGFGIPPLFIGVSGSTGLSYSIGPAKQLWDKLLNYFKGGRF